MGCTGSQSTLQSQPRPYQQQQNQQQPNFSNIQNPQQPANNNNNNASLQGNSPNQQNQQLDGSGSFGQQQRGGQPVNPKAASYQVPSQQSANNSQQQQQRQGASGSLHQHNPSQQTFKNQSILEEGEENEEDDDDEGGGASDSQYDSQGHTIRTNKESLKNSAPQRDQQSTFLGNTNKSIPFVNPNGSIDGGQQPRSNGSIEPKSKSSFNASQGGSPLHNQRSSIGGAQSPPNRSNNNMKDQPVFDLGEAADGLQRQFKKDQEVTGPKMNLQNQYDQQELMKKNQEMTNNINNLKSAGDYTYPAGSNEYTNQFSVTPGKQPSDYGKTTMINRFQDAAAKPEDKLVQELENSFQTFKTGLDQLKSSLLTDKKNSQSQYQQQIQQPKVQQHDVGIGLTNNNFSIKPEQMGSSVVQSQLPQQQQQLSPPKVQYYNNSYGGPSEGPSRITEYRQTNMPVSQNNDKIAEEEDDDEYAPKYYNFDQSFGARTVPVKQTLKSTPGGSPGVDNKLKENQQKIGAKSEQLKLSPNINNNKMQDSQTTKGQPVDSSTNNNFITGQSIPNTKQQYNQQFDSHSLQQLKNDFLMAEERDRLNPQNVLLRMLFIHTFVNNTQERKLDRKLYQFFINKNSNVMDVKNKIKGEFGFDQSQIQVYFRYLPLIDIQYVLEVPRFDIEEDILLIITIDQPRTLLKVILREPLDDIKISDVRFLNSTDRAEPHKNQNLQYDFDVDQDKLPWPLYRDWTAECAFITDIVVNCKHFLLSEAQTDNLWSNQISNLPSSKRLSELVDAEVQLNKLMDDFRQASIYAVHLIVKKNPTPLNLFNLYGDDGDKYIVGGIFVRRAKGWTVCGNMFTDGPSVGAPDKSNMLENNGTATNTVNKDISAKIAALDVRNLALMRGKIKNLVVPLACVVDYYGIRFETQSLAPISINSLVYGSDTDGLVFTDDYQESEELADTMASCLNLKRHFIEEKATKTVKQIHLPFTVQLHKNKEIADTKVYLVNAYRLFPFEEQLRNTAPTGNKQAQTISDLMSKQLRPELVINNHTGDQSDHYKYFTWREPTLCNECNEYIMEYEYYYFEKKGLDKSQSILTQYYCCLSCYTELMPTEGFKYPINKIFRKELPVKDRISYWKNLLNGQKTFSIPYKKIPLNADSFSDVINRTNIREAESDQEEIFRTCQKLKDEVLELLIEDLNNVNEDPLDPTQLEECLHKRGIPMRYLGKLCTAAGLNHIREIMVIEILSRTIKQIIRDGMTFLANDESAQFKHDQIKKLIQHYFKEVFTLDLFQNSSQNIWDFITEHTRSKFLITIEKETLHKIHLNSLFLNICEKMNIKLNKDVRSLDFFANEKYNNNNGGDPAPLIDLDDILSIKPIAKDYKGKQIAIISKEDTFPSSLNIVLEASKFKDSLGKRTNWFNEGGPERQEATDLYRMGCGIAEQIFGQLSMEYAVVLKEFAEHLESRHQEHGRPENSRWNKSASIPEDEFSQESRYYNQIALNIYLEQGLEYSPLCAQIYTSLARLYKSTPNIYSNYRENQQQSENLLFEHLTKAVDIYETCLGFDHPETAEAYTKIALAYQELGNFPLASPWIRRSFTIFYKIFGPYDPITLNAYEYLKAIEANIDSKLESVPYEDLPAMIEQLQRQIKEATAAAAEYMHPVQSNALMLR